MHGSDAMAKRIASSPQRKGGHALHEAKAKQAAKLRQIGDSLAAVGFVTVREQSDALGLSRSTAWTILRGSHKASGLSASVINRILRRPLPLSVRMKLIEYIGEKAAGRYGHHRSARLKFVAQLSPEHVDRTELHKIVEDRAA